MHIPKSDIEKLIESNTKSTYLNHLWNFLWKDYTAKGEIKKNEIKVWQQNMWNFGFYPIFTFELDENNHLINISDELNPVAKTIIGILFIGALGLIAYNFPPIAEINGYLVIIAIVIIYAFLFVTVFRKIYESERQNQLDAIFDFLEIEVGKKEVENEWSLKNIMVRLLTYPFCLALIALNIWILIPEGQYLLALGSLLAVGYYLVPDLILIFRKKR